MDKREQRAVGRKAYEAFGKAMGWDLVPWVTLSEHVKDAWCSCACGVRVAK